MHEVNIFTRILGFILSLALTIGAYFLMVRPHFFNLKIENVVLIIFILALLQFIVQLLFFISLWKEKGPPWNLSVFISTISIVLIIIAFSIWIMDTLNYRM